MDEQIHPDTSQLLIDGGQRTDREIMRCLADLIDGDPCWHGYNPADLACLLRATDYMDLDDCYLALLDNAVFVDGNGLSWRLVQDISDVFLVRITPTDAEMEGIPQ